MAFLLISFVEISLRQIPLHKARNCTSTFKVFIMCMQIAASSKEGPQLDKCKGRVS